MKHPLTSEMLLLSSLYFCILNCIVHMYITFLPLYKKINLLPLSFYVYSSFSADESIHLLCVCHAFGTFALSTTQKLRVCLPYVFSSAGSGRCFPRKRISLSNHLSCSTALPVKGDYLCWVPLGTLQSTTKQTSPQTNSSERKGFYPHGFKWPSLLGFSLRTVNTYKTVERYEVSVSILMELP